MEVDTSGKITNITIDNEEELVLLNLAMKEAEATDEDMELEAPTLAQGGDHLLQTVQAILEGIHQDVLIKNLTNQGKMDTLPSKNDEVACTHKEFEWNDEDDIIAKPKVMIAHV